MGDVGVDEDNTFLSSHRSHPINPLDRAQTKRSMLSTFAHMNAHTGGKLDLNDIQASEPEDASGSRLQSTTGNGYESQVGSDMRGRTGQRVAIGLMLALLFTVIFTYTDSNTTRPTTMVVLHHQTMNDLFRMNALHAARISSVPSMYLYEPVNQSPVEFPLDGVENLKDRERIRYVVNDSLGQESAAEFDFREETVNQALVEIVATLFIVLVWFFGVLAFAGPVSSLVVVPIERMVRLLGMLMMDPLGYQSTQKFRSFLFEEENLINTTGWTREVLRGMETSFLMSTILRIGSLMKVGFGSAGVEIIRNNLLKGQSKNMLILTTQGSTVSCIFLFCDIRQFTDATECLQEEVFVFTNRIAAVVHSICHSYGGAANKNVGDAFLLSWSLEDYNANNRHTGARMSIVREGVLRAERNQADKALLSVIKICMSLHYDNFYLEPLSEGARNKLKDKLKKRSGPVVQMGFGLHAGKAVQGAIGSQKKIDATYVSEAVERAEFLESSTKQYGLQLLMSGNFHKLLHPNTRRRCRKIDRVLLQDDDEAADEDDDSLHGELMELFTFDMDVAAIHRPQTGTKSDNNDTISEKSGSVIPAPEPHRRARKMERRLQASYRQARNQRRSSVQLRSQQNGSEELAGTAGSGANENSQRGTTSLMFGSTYSTYSVDDENVPAYQGDLPELVLPTGPALYSHNIWQSPDMKRIRDKFAEGVFFQKFQSGMQAYYNKDWDLARQCFQTVLEHVDDGPSKYFMDQMMKNNSVPPKDFLGYNLA
jgi:class 3 adenylate cyclase